MDSDRLNRWLTLGANVGVLVGIILLIVEIGQNTEMMRAQINQMRADSAMNYQYAYFNSEYLPAIMQKIRNGDELSDEEVARYSSYFRAFNRNQDNNLWQYNQGYLGDNIPRAIEGAIREVVGGSAISIAMWDLQKSGYTDEYVAFVEEAIVDLRDQVQ